MFISLKEDVFMVLVLVTNLIILLCVFIIIIINMFI